MKKVLIIIGLILVATMAVVFIYEKPREDPNTWSVPNTQRPEGFTLLFVGDIMLDRDVASSVNENGDGDPTYPFALIADKLRPADVTVGNLEGPISDKGTRVGSIYSFRMDPKFIDGLTFAGFDVLSLANNHMWDYGRNALTDTIDRLRVASIGTAGAGKNFEEANTPHIETLLDGTRIAFLSYTNLYPSNLEARGMNPGISNSDLDFIKLKIAEARSDADLVVILYHWGEEYQEASNTTQQQIAHALVDAGADLIVGHHPHVAQEIEQYKDKYIAYSLGNFIFDQYFSEETMRGLILKVTVTDKKIKTVEPIEVQLTNTFQPFILNRN